MGTAFVITLSQAIVLFLATNIDHLVLLTLWFVRGRGRSGSTARIFAGQYLGFGSILAVTAILGITSGFIIPEEHLRWLGLLPLLIGLKAGFDEIRERVPARRAADGTGEDDDDAEKLAGKPLSILSVAAVTIANGGDEIGVYIPVFAISEPWQIGVYVVVFLLLAGVLLTLAKLITDRAGVGELLERLEAILFPGVLIFLGILILADIL